MAMQFAPNTAFLRGMDLGSPTTSQGGINNLLQMQQNALGGMVDSFGNIGKTSRTNTVNDLIARGGLEGLNEAQTQAEILKQAGGTLTPEGQHNVDKLLQTVGVQDKNKFTTSERLGGEQSTRQENAIKAEALYNQNKAVAEAKLSSETVKNALEKELKGLELTQKEKDSMRDYKASIYGHQVTSQGQKQVVQGDDGMQYYADKVTGKLIPLVKGVLPEHASGSGGGSGVNKLTGEIKTLWDDSTGKGKLALEEMYKTGELQAVPIIKSDKNGKPYKAGQKLLYKNVPITIGNLRHELGLTSK